MNSPVSTPAVPPRDGVITTAAVTAVVAHSRLMQLSSPLLTQVPDSSGPPAPHPPPTTKQTLTVEEAASMLGIGRTLAYELIRQNRFPVAVVQLGARYLIPRAPLERLLNGDMGTA